ncbi:MAG: MFS transporter [Parcubacteria group bacterium]|jgi:MFS family permease
MHKEQLDKNKLHLTSFVTLLMGFSQAVLVYIMSFYFELSSGIKSVGMFYGLSYAVFLVVLLNFHKLVRLWGKSAIFYYSLLAKIIILAALIFIEPSKATILLMMLYIVFVHVEWVALDVIVESFSIDRLSGRIRGLHLMIISAGFLCGPFISTYMLEKMNFQGVFMLTLIFNCFVFIFSLIGFRKANHHFEQRIKVWDVLNKVIQKKDILRIYYIALVLDFFYAMMTIYTPIHLYDLGYSLEQIGVIFTIMLLPFVILQYPMGMLADKKTGEKEFIIFSLLILAFSTLAVYFIGVGTLFVWAFVLFLTRIGAALLEILRDSYFFKKIDANDVDMIGFFRTSLPVAYIIATMFSTLILFFLSMKFIFIVAGIVVLSALYPAFKLIDNKAENEM